MVRNKLKNMALSIAVLMGLGMASPVFAKSDYNPGDILALGSDLTDAQEAALRKYFNAPDGTNTIYVTDEVIIKQLGLDPNDPANYAGGCYSSAYVKLLDDNSGINVKATNLTEVTESMLMNALITSGITAADVKVSSPFKVTGTSALSGILAGVEEVGGFEISLKQKETAQKEIETTVEVGDEIGSEEASTIINDIKTEVIKEQPKTEEEIKKIVENITNQYNVNDLGLDYSELKSSLKEASNKLSNNLKELGIKLKEEGFFEKIKNWFVDLWDKFINLFRSNDNNEEESKENAPLDFNQEPIKEQSDDENQNLEEEIRPVDDTQIGDTITEDSVNDENVNEDTTTSEEKQVSDDTNTNSSTMDS